MRPFWNTYALKQPTTASRTSKAACSVFFPARRFWKIVKMGSSFFSARISFDALGIIAETNLAIAGTFPLVSHFSGDRMLSNRALNPGRLLVVLSSRSMAKIWNTYATNSAGHQVSDVHSLGSV